MVHVVSGCRSSALVSFIEGIGNFMKYAWLWLALRTLAFREGFRSQPRCTSRTGRPRCRCGGGGLLADDVPLLERDRDGQDDHEALELHVPGANGE